jgi:hypothetical protein
VTTRLDSVFPGSKLKLKCQLDRARAADLIEGVEAVNNASNPGASGPDNYFALGPNSNTYVRFLLLAGKCTPPAHPPAFAPGYNSPIAVPRPPLGR